MPLGRAKRPLSGRPLDEFTVPTSPSKPQTASNPAMHDDTAPAPQAHEPTSARARKRARHAEASNSRRVWSDEDTAALLQRAFLSRTGAALNSSAGVAAFFDSISASLPPHITQEQVYNKLRHLRHRHLHSTAAYTAPSLRLLCLQVWGDAGSSKAEVDRSTEGDERDAGEGFLHVLEPMEEYCEKNGMSAPPAVEWLKRRDPEKMRALEEKWRRHWRANMKLTAKCLELACKQALGACLQVVRHGSPVLRSLSFSMAKLFCYCYR